MPPPGRDFCSMYTQQLHGGMLCRIHSILIDKLINLTTYVSSIKCRIMSQYFFDEEVGDGLICCMFVSSSVSKTVSIL